MNLRQLEEMVKVLRSKGYHDDTKIFAELELDTDETGLREVEQVTAISDEGKDQPAFIIMSGNFTKRAGEFFNTNFASSDASFPENFPGPQG